MTLKEFKEALITSKVNGKKMRVGMENKVRNEPAMKDLILTITCFDKDRAREWHTHKNKLKEFEESKWGIDFEEGILIGDQCRNVHASEGIIISREKTALPISMSGCNLAVMVGESSAINICTSSVEMQQDSNAHFAEMSWITMKDRASIERVNRSEISMDGKAKIKNAIGCLIKVSGDAAVENSTRCTIRIKDESSARGIVVVGEGSEVFVSEKSKSKIILKEGSVAYVQKGFNFKRIIESEGIIKIEQEEC